MKNPLIIAIVYLLAEIALFITVGQMLGVFQTLLVIIATSVIGIFVLKNKGTKSFKSIQTTMQQGQAPGAAMVETFIIYLGGILLVLPGFITDLLGLLLITKWTRNLFKPAIFYWMRKKMKNNQVVIYQK